MGSAIMTEPRHLGCMVPAEVGARGVGSGDADRWSLWQPCQSPALDLGPLVGVGFPAFPSLLWDALGLSCKSLSHILTRVGFCCVQTKNSNAIFP